MKALMIRLHDGTVYDTENNVIVTNITYLFPHGQAPWFVVTTDTSEGIHHIRVEDDDVQHVNWDLSFMGKKK